jgi:hypothetical protein
MFLFNDLIDWPIVSDRLQWEGKQVLRDLAGEPHIFFRLKLSGTFFPERSSEPFVQIGKLRSRFVRIAPDGLSANAYFDQSPPSGGVVEFGYGSQVYLRCSRRFESGNIARLNRALLPANVRNLDRFAQALEGPEPVR